MAKKGNKALKQRPRRGEVAVLQTRSERPGRPSRRTWIWNDEQRDRFIDELRDSYSKLAYTDVTEIVTEFANELSVEISSIQKRQKPNGAGSVERAVRYAIAHRSGRRALPACYVIPTIDYLGLEEESVAFLFPHLPRDRTALVNKGKNRGQSSSDLAVQATGKSAAGDTQSDAVVTLRSPSKTLATREDTPQ